MYKKIHNQQIIIQTIHHYMIKLADKLTFDLIMIEMNGKFSTLSDNVLHATDLVNLWYSRNTLKLNQHFLVHL